MLIRNADVWGVGMADVQIEGGVIASINMSARRMPGPPVASTERAASGPGANPELRLIDARGGALLPGLHDHHIHLAGLAARSASVMCGPPEVTTAAALAERLSAQPGQGWIRGIGYHQSVMGFPGAGALDRLVPDRPLRLQHRSGRMWLLNSLALDELLAVAAPPPGLEREGDHYTGRVFDEDHWLRTALASSFPDLAAISADLSRCGVTGITDMSPHNDAAIVAHFAAQHCAGGLQQNCWLAGELSLADAQTGEWRLGPAKLHLHESALPAFDHAAAFVTAAHRQRRGVAIHCVSEVELVFALALFDEAGTAPGDRIEHASVAPPQLVSQIAALRLAVCTQPHFIFERGDAYLRDVEPRHHGDLYRLASLAEAGIVLAGGSDAPFASADPWAAMRAAVSRQTGDGAIVGSAEALTPEAALALYLAAPDQLSRQRHIAVGEPADLCLLGTPWSEARNRLVEGDVCATIIAGELVYDCVNQAPIQRNLGGNALT